MSIKLEGNMTFINSTNYVEYILTAKPGLEPDA